MDSARIALEQARVDLDRRRITAPFSGRVGITEIDVGDRIDTNTLVTTIDDRSVLLVNFSVPEVYVDKVTRGTPVDVSLWDAADAPVSGEIVAVDSRIDINSRSFIARAAIDNAPAGSKWSVGTELNLVKRLALNNPDKEIVYLDKTVCFCSTMNRIDLPHLVWALESLAAGHVVNQIDVDSDTEHWAKVALDRMLALPGPTPDRD